MMSAPSPVALILTVRRSFSCVLSRQLGFRNGQVTSQNTLLLVYKHPSTFGWRCTATMFMANVFSEAV